MGNWNKLESPPNETIVLVPPQTLGKPRSPNSRSFHIPCHLELPLQGQHVTVHASLCYFFLPFLICREYCLAPRSFQQSAKVLLKCKQSYNSAKSQSPSREVCLRLRTKSYIVKIYMFKYSQVTKIRHIHNLDSTFF